MRNLNSGLRVSTGIAILAATIALANGLNSWALGISTGALLFLLNTLVGREVVARIVEGRGVKRAVLFSLLKLGLSIVLVWVTVGYFKVDPIAFLTGVTIVLAGLILGGTGTRKET